MPIFLGNKSSENFQRVLSFGPQGCKHMHFPKPVIIGRSRGVIKILEIIRKVSDVDLNVLITGESGVGKELVVRSLHYYSRPLKPFVKINTAALPSELVESELFGYEKGAFTGADSRKKGLFEFASDGSLFLDEIGELPLSLQAKLLQVLQEKHYQPIGGSKEIKVHARIIAATNQNLEMAIAQGIFRPDLFYRLSTISIDIPPLRERKEDIPELVEHFNQKIKSNNTDLKLNIPQRLMDLFMLYHWPGNVRELENYLSRLSILQNYQELEEEILQNLPGMEKGSQPFPLSSEVSENPEQKKIQHLESFPSLKKVRDLAIKNVEREVISKVLLETNWNRKETARVLKISYRALLYKIKDMKLKPPFN